MKKPKLKTVILDGVEIKDYLVSEAGEVYRLFKDCERQPWENKTLKNNVQNSLVTFDKKKRFVKRLKPCYDLQGYRRFVLSFPANSFEYQYFNESKDGTRERRKVNLHQIVMQTFQPFEKFLPKEINKEDYDKVPESMKVFIRQAFIVNHIDHDKKNNSVNNLEWITVKANGHKAVKHYGGNFANAISNDTSTAIYKNRRGA